MFSISLIPRFAETDALGHINNTVVPVWFESGRADIFKIFNPAQDLALWNLIIAKVEVNFLAQISYQQPVEIRTHISHIGNSSFTVLQEVYQQDRVAWGECVMVKFDYSNQTSVSINDKEKNTLGEHLVNKQQLLAK